MLHILYFFIQNSQYLLETVLLCTFYINSDNAISNTMHLKLHICNKIIPFRFKISIANVYILTLHNR